MSVSMANHAQQVLHSAKEKLGELKSWKSSGPFQTWALLERLAVLQLDRLVLLPRHFVHLLNRAQDPTAIAELIHTDLRKKFKKSVFEMMTASTFILRVKAAFSREETR